MMLLWITTLLDDREPRLEQDGGYGVLGVLPESSVFLYGLLSKCLEFVGLPLECIMVIVYWLWYCYQRLFNPLSLVFSVS